MITLPGNRFCDYQAKQGKHAKEDKAPKEGASTLADEAEHQRRKEATQSSRRAYQASHRPDGLGKVFRNQLEDRAITQANGGSHAQRSDGEQHHLVGREKYGRDGNTQEDPKQNLESANLVSEPSTHGPHGGSQQHETGSAHSGIFGSELEYFGQEHRQVNAHGNEPAEGQEIEEAEHPAHTIREWLQHCPQSLRRQSTWSVFGHGKENQEPNRQQTA